MSSVSWRVIEWSPELGRGRIGSPASAPLVFYASAATVDDFEIGEEVRIELARNGEAWEVTSIRPATNHFEPPKPGGRAAPELQRDLAESAESIIGTMRLHETYQVHQWTPGLLVLRGEEVTPYPPPSDLIEFVNPAYAELPGWMELEKLRLSTFGERAYLATKTEDFSSSHVAVTLIDCEDRYFFVVCSALRYREPTS